MITHIVTAPALVLLLFLTLSKVATHAAVDQPDPFNVFTSRDAELFDGAAPPLDSAGEHLVRLLKDQDAERFASSMAPTAEDWRPVRIMFPDDRDEIELERELQTAVGDDRARVAAEARRFAAEAAGYGLDLNQVRFRVKAITAKPSNIRLDDARQAQLRSSPEVRIVLSGELKEGADSRWCGEYEVVLLDMLQFPSGWRCSHKSIRWLRFPESLVDDSRHRELRALYKVAVGQNLTSADDPALEALGSALSLFLQTGDEDVFAQAALLEDEEILQRLSEEFAEDSARPSETEIKAELQAWREEVVASARTLLADLDRIGVDLYGSEIQLQDVTATGVWPGDARGLQGLRSRAIHFVFHVRSDRLTRTGRPIHGEYVLTSLGCLRGPEMWTIEDRVRWEKFPDGLLGGKELAELEFENRLAIHSVLPPGTMAPEIKLVRIEDETKVALSEWRGRVVILEFWATWCGPCQRSMAQLQTLRQKHPGWKDRVEIISVSIDDQLASARRHLLRRGWENTDNFWAGPGGWDSAAAQAFRIRGIPRAYVIDAEGRITHAGSADAAHLGMIVHGLLN